MTTTLLTTGLACMIAAIIGGGLKALGTEIPVIKSRNRQVALGLFGVALIITAFVIHSPQPELPQSSHQPSERSPTPTPQKSPSKPAELSGTTWQGFIMFPTDDRSASISVSFKEDHSALYHIHIWETLTDTKICNWEVEQNEMPIKIDCPQQLNAPRRIMLLRFKGSSMANK